MCVDGRFTSRAGFHLFFICCGSMLRYDGTHVNVTATLFNVSLHVSALIVLIHICVINAVISSTGVFVAITNNTLYGSKLYIFILCQISLGYYVP